MGTLDGVGVLVTRPQMQAASLCRLLEAQGARTELLPALVIEPLATPRELAARLGPLEPTDLIVFTSANAVRYGAPLLAQRRDLALAAIGPATMRALNAAGYRVSVVPAGGFDSEHLLAEPRLQHLEGRRVVIVKGAGGRELLAEELERRGAALHPIDVYRRRPASPGPAELERVTAQIAAGDLQVVTATSLEIAEALLGFADAPLRAALGTLHWLVPGARIAAGLEPLGMRAPLIVAESAQDQSLVEALLRWRSSASGA